MYKGFLQGLGEATANCERERAYTNELPDDVKVAKESQQHQRHYFEPTELAQMVIDYTEHRLTVYQLADKYSCHRTAISKQLKQQGINVTRNRMDENQIETAKQLYASGLTLKQVGQQMGITKSTIRVTLANAGVSMRKRHDYKPTPTG